MYLEKIPPVSYEFRTVYDGFMARLISRVIAVTHELTQLEVQGMLEAQIKVVEEGAVVSELDPLHSSESVDLTTTVVNGLVLRPELVVPRNPVHQGFGMYLF
jgi:hypothetical protein